MRDRAQVKVEGLRRDIRAVRPNYGAEPSANLELEESGHGLPGFVDRASKEGFEIDLPLQAVGKRELDNEVVKMPGDLHREVRF